MKSSKSPIAVIFITVFIDLVSFGIVIPLLPFYAQEFGASGIMIGLLLSVFSLMAFLFMPIWGRLSDRMGRRPILLLTIATSFVAYLIFSTAGSLWMLFVARILAGIANANISVAQAYISDVTTAEERSKGMGLIGAAFGLGFIFGPLISSVFSTDYFGDMKYVLPGYIAAGLCGVNFLMAYFRLPESLKDEHRAAAGSMTLLDLPALRRALTQPQLGRVIWMFGIVTVAFSSIYASMPLFIMEEPFHLSSSGMSWFFVEIGVISVIVQGGLIGKLTLLFGERRLVVMGSSLMAVGLVGLPLSAYLPLMPMSGLIVATALLSMGSSCLAPSVMSLSSQLADPSEQGSILGITQSFASLARMVGPTIGGIAYDGFGHASPFYFAFATMVPAVWLGIGLLKFHPNKNHADK